LLGLSPPLGHEVQVIQHEPVEKTAMASAAPALHAMACRSPS
jgi:hypothetical protein